MSADPIRFAATASGQPSETAVSPPAEKLLIDMAELARLTSLSVRTLRRMDSAGDIPGRVAVGRRVT